MDKFRFNFLCFLFLFLFSSCDYRVREYYIINNLSGHDICVSFDIKDVPSAESNGLENDTIYSLQKKHFYEIESCTGCGNLIREGDDYLKIFDTIFISIDKSNKSIKKDIANPKNWEYFYNTKERTISIVFTIEKEDISPQ